MIRRALLFLIIAVISVLSVNAQIYLGTVDGYVFYMNNTFVDSGNVSAAVSGCSGTGCSASTLSQSNGYYVIANLNLPISGLIRVNSSKGNAFGNASGNANSFQAARVNITICEPPGVPMLIDQTNTHNTSVILYWTSGTDPNAYATYDQYQLDSGAITTETSPKTETSLSFASYTWKVRTCNTNGVTGCCSAFVSDTFTVYNNAPSTPSLVPVNDSHNTSAFFYWSSGIDPDGDSTYDQFQLDSGAIINATSPVNETNLSFSAHTWNVRTCDSLGACSAFASDSFNTGNSFPTAPTVQDQPPTNQTSVSLNWTSGTDTDGDIIRDEFQFSIYSDFSSLSSNITNASHPVNITSLSTLTIYYWRVRSCDSTGCSSWSEDSFFTYPQCPSVPSGGGASCGGGGGGGGGTGVFCIPNWKCNNWGRCEDGFVRRECEDKNRCFQIPEVAMTCRVEAKEKPEEKGAFYLGDLSISDIISKKSPMEQEWLFIFNNKNHTITITGVGENSLEFLISGAQVSLKKFESSALDIDKDGRDDALFMLDDLKPSEKEATISLLKTLNEKGEIIENPYSYISVKEKWEWLWIFAIMTEFVIILYFYYKTKNLLHHIKK